MIPERIGALGVLGLVVAIWVLYLLVEVAQHVNAWPFGG